MNQTSMCPELSDIPNGIVTVINRRPGGIANYSCLKDYYLSGEQTRVCGQDGKWSCKEPTCKFCEWRERNKLIL